MKAILMGISIIAMVIGAVVLENRRLDNMEAYAEAHNCTWQWQGTMYGDNRDYICK